VLKKFGEKMEYKSRITVLERSEEQKDKDEVYKIIEKINKRTTAALSSEERKKQMD
jgi:hypothetical protein